MKSPFTPVFVAAKQRRKVQALFLVIALTPLVIYQLTTNVNATQTKVWSATTDLASGTYSNTMDSNGAITLQATSTTDSTRADFVLGDIASDLFAKAGVLEGEGVQLSQAHFLYNNASNPGYAGTFVRDILFAHDLVYVAMEWNGLYVFDTNGTYTDNSDDTLVARYFDGSTPGLAHSYVYTVELYGDLLYMGTALGLTVVDTKGTFTDMSDDTLVTRYHTGGSPAIVGNSVRSILLDGDILYMGTYGAGASAIDTKGTKDPSDDVLVKNYTTASSPALAGNEVWQLFADGDLVYFGTFDGLSVIDTMGTVDASDDSLLISYNETSEPALSVDGVTDALLVDDTLYIPDGQSLMIIDTKGTKTLADDTTSSLGPESTPPLNMLGVTSMHKGGDFIYVRTYEGDFVIVDTQGTGDITDDAVDEEYSKILSASSNSSYDFFVDEYHLFLAGNDGVDFFAPDTYVFASTYVGSPRQVSRTPTTTISFDADIAGGQDVALSYRTGTSADEYVNDFNDGVTTEYLGDWGGWGTSFQSAVESGGTIKLSNPSAGENNGGEYVDFWLDTGMADNYFPIATIVTARVRINSDTRQNHSGWEQYMFNDDWWDDNGGVILSNNEWETLSFTANYKTFSKIGFEINWESGTWAPDDTFEIDWIRIAPTPIGNQWGSWIACPDQKCILPDLGAATWLQYKLNLSTDDTDTTPVVHSVSYNGDYAGTGTYTSPTESFTRSQDLLAFNADDTTPDGTGITYEYSLDGGSTWNAISPGTNLSQYDVTTDSFTWRATLTTLDPAYTPSITSVTLTTAPHQNQTSTSLRTQVERLEANGQHEAAAELRLKYPHYFNGTARPEEIQKAIIIRLEEVISLYGKLKALQEEETE